jgi:hypothetical protein
LTAKLASRYIKIHAVSSSPGNEVCEYFIKVDSISGFGEASSQHALIGAGSALDLHSDIRMYLKESMEELYDLLNKVDALP